MIKPVTFKTEPTFLGTVGEFRRIEFRLYENPIYGDEAPLLVKLAGQFWETDFWDFPQYHELMEWVYENDMC